MPRDAVFVCDQDFPETFLSQLKIPGLRVIPLRLAHPDLTRDHEDWEVMRELKARGGVDGWITLDSKMLNLKKEMVVLHQTRLSLIVFQDVRNDPVIATGLLMVHLPLIAGQTRSTQSQLWVLRRPATRMQKPWDRVIAIASQQRLTPRQLYNAEKVPYTDLNRDPRRR